jgi:hypothetical protein
MDNPDISLKSVFYPLDVREDDPSQCVKYWTNGYVGTPSQTFVSRPTDVANNMIVAPSGNSLVLMPGSTATLGGRSPNVTRVNSSDSLSDGFMRWTMKNTWQGTAGEELCRCWFTDLGTSENPAFQIGDCEVDVVARVRMNFNGETTTNSTLRVGIIPRHAPYNPNTNLLDGGGAAMFLASRISPNWTIRLVRVNLMDFSFDQLSFPTFVPWDQWATLRVWASKYGDWVRFYINGQLILTATNVSHTKYLHTINDARLNTGQMCGVFFRKDDQYTTTTHPHADVDFAVTKMFYNRTGTAPVEDIIPNTISYAPIGYDTVDDLYTYSQHQITGIDRPIRVKVEYSGAATAATAVYFRIHLLPAQDGEPQWSLNGSNPESEAFTRITSNSSFVVSPNQYLSFGYDGPAGIADGYPSNFTITLREAETNTQIAQFDCITTSGMGGPL